MTNDFIAQYQSRVEQYLVNTLPSDALEPMRLHQAMHYSVLGGGKRIRPLLVYATGHFFATSLDKLDASAMAVELIHCYSLVHDDLPAMDNDDLRRGKPTCHKAFDEATAMLAGDALQAEAFALLADDKTNDASQRVDLLSTLGRACGSLGMAGGQAIDLGAVDQLLNLAQLEKMHRLKTGALIEASVLMGAIVGQADSKQFAALQEFAQLIGLTFQIQDDILDVEGSTEQLGKQQGADSALNKPTYPGILGLQKAKELAQVNYDKALSCIADFGAAADQLRQVADYIIRRDH
jgi:farnesyl diphosphate synthase